MLFELKKYRGVIFHDIEQSCKIKKKPTLLNSDVKLKKNRLVAWKMTWGSWQIFTIALESVKIGTLMGSFCPKQKMYDLKIYRGVICHDNEE